MAYECEYNSDGEPIEQSAPVKLAFHVEYIANNAIKLLDELIALEKATFKKGDSWADGDLVRVPSPGLAPRAAFLQTTDRPLAPNPCRPIT